MEHNEQSVLKLKEHPDGDMGRVYYMTEVLYEKDSARLSSLIIHGMLKEPVRRPAHSYSGER